MNHHWPHRSLAIALMLAPGAVFANGMRVVSQDAFASARGEAFVATADNASAIYYNPAGLTQLEGDQVRSGLYALSFDIDYRPPDTAANAGNTYEADPGYAFVPQMFYTHTTKDGDLSFGLGIYAPHGAKLDWPQDTGFRSVALGGELTYLRANPVIAFKLAPTLSIGMGLMVDYAEITLEQGLLRTAQPFANNFRFNGDGWNVGWNAGLLWQPHEKLSFGATFRSAASITFSGETDIQQQPIIPATSRDAKAEFEFPWTAVVGVSYRPTPRWNYEINADYTDWSTFDSVLIRQATPPPFPVRQNIPVNLEWEGSWLFGVGATRYFDNGWRASAGYVFNQNSVPDDYYSPMVADLDRHFITVGVGKRGRRIDLDVAYQFGYGPDHTVTGSTPSSQPGLFSGQRADGTYGFLSHALFVTIGARF
jgi:long-chain fatty acid transport protein